MSDIENSKVGDPERPLGVATMILPKVYAGRQTNPEKDYWLEKERADGIANVIENNIQRMGQGTLRLAKPWRRI